MSKCVTGMARARLLAGRLHPPLRCAGLHTGRSAQLAVGPPDLPDGPPPAPQRKPPGRVRVSLIARYLEHVRRAEAVIERKFPTAMHLYRTFKVGMGEFLGDLRQYLRVVRKLSAQGLDVLSRSELELYMKMRRDTVKVAPVLALLALPGTNYVVFPVTYYFPRQFLCSHFWTLQQRAEFAEYDLRQRLLHNRPTLRWLQAELAGLRAAPQHGAWRRVLGLLGSGAQPAPPDLLQCRALFCGAPYGLQHLRRGHAASLARLHGLRGPLAALVPALRRRRLLEHARLLRALDRAVQREGGPAALPHDALRAACLLRGLNPANARRQDLELWLCQWLVVSGALPDDRCLSLLLHTPVLLAYNQPANWRLIY